MSGGAEAIVHAIRILDFSNAFNSVRRETVLDKIAEKIPELYKFSSLFETDVWYVHSPVK